MASDPSQTNTEPGDVADLRVRAEQGDAQAQYDLACAYSEGQGVPLSEESATEWFRKAAEQEHVEAQFCLGATYQFGLGVAPDLVRAVAWYCRAAAQGDADAMYQLGLGYATGEAVPEDVVEAFMWMHLAVCRATGGNRERYTQGLNMVARSMTRAQITRARRMATAWTRAFEGRPAGVPTRWGSGARRSRRLV